MYPANDIGNRSVCFQSAECEQRLIRHNTLYNIIIIRRVLSMSFTFSVHWSTCFTCIVHVLKRRWNRLKALVFMKRSGRDFACMLRFFLFRAR